MGVCKGWSGRWSTIIFIFVIIIVAYQWYDVPFYAPSPTLFVHQILENVAMKCSPNFRCFLTVEHVPGSVGIGGMLPEGLLQVCTKVTCGIVAGLQANIKVR